MVYYDQATKDFMEKFADTPEEDSRESVAKKALGVVSAVVAKKPKALIGPLARVIASELLKKEAEALILKIYQLLNDKYDREWWDWEPETLWKTLLVDGVANVGSQTAELKNIVMALQLLVNSNVPFEAWHIFEKVGHALNHNPVDFAIIQPLELDEVALTLKIMQTIRPKQEFEPEVCGYIAACAKTAGVVYLPDELFSGGCQSFLDDLGNHIPLKEEVKKTWPRHIKGNTALAIQLQRLHEVREYVAAGV